VSTADVQVRRRYSRSDARGNSPRLTGAVGVDCNRLGMFWRPLVDMAPSDLAPMRLRMIQPVSEWIGDPRVGRVSWFSRIGVPGLRNQVLRHAGLEQYNCPRPQALPAELRGPQWERLVAALDDFARLDDYTRALVVFQLAQLTFCHYAVSLTGVVAPAGQPGRDHYAYQVARVHSRVPGQTDTALRVFEALTARRHDPLLALLAAAQGVSHGIRGKGDTSIALRFEQAGREIGRQNGPLPEDDWHAHLALSRFRPADMRDELRAAWDHHERTAALAAAGADGATGEGAVTAMVVTENRRILIESEIKACFRGVDGTESAATLLKFARELALIDPNCVEARLVVGDGHVAVGDYASAARWYAEAGELGTVSGATGWYRAAQCYDQLDDHVSAVNAMGHCLELDTTAIEPQQYLTRLSA
jgi:hypothetical protein